MKVNISQIKRCSLQYKRVKEDAAKFMMTGDVKNYLRKLIKAAQIEGVMLQA